MLYFAGIRALGEQNYIETGDCLESGFVNWLKRAAKIQNKTGKRIFVDFRQRAHTFEITTDGEPHLLTPEAPIPVDPAYSTLFEGD